MSIMKYKTMDEVIERGKKTLPPYQFPLTPYGMTLKKPKTHRVRGFLKANAQALEHRSRGSGQRRRSPGGQPIV